MKTITIILALTFLFIVNISKATTIITAPCDSTTHQSAWYSIGADASSDFRINAGSDEKGNSCDVQTTAWNRDHWTITCWVTSSSSNHTSYTCHNWNTVFGDSWKASFSYMACPQSGCVTSKEEQSMIQNIKESIKNKDTHLMRDNSN
jgi:hypothetical protein